eukprot:TRINITY_DN6741_c0_g1_i1.p1 TRINITY_DN6741_c0_g1~~TRINITY_DN6741_c0_g1_i1.p1  ORF type:complete len:376 (+),score=103.51 TRINITY_DN6741_c0_g1_i1:121-1248(+)
MLWKSKNSSEVKPQVEEDDENQEIVCEDVSLTSMFGPFIKNYTSSLSSGKQVSKMPYPVNFYFPNSSLQHQATIQMTHIDLLLAANMQTDPLERFLCVVQYALSTCSLTKFPYKPIIAFPGETAHHHVSHSTDERTYFLGEQVARDPPAAAFYINNPTKGVTHAGNIELAPKFNKTHVHVKVNGEQKTTLVDPNGRWNEEYFMETPDVAIRLFRMLTELTGKISIACPSNGFAAVLSFKDKPLFGGHKNVVVGKITKNNAEIATLEGVWDETIRITDANGTREFFNKNTISKKKLEQPETVPETAGHKIWAPLLQALTDKDYKTAKNLKEKIDAENAAREAKSSGPSYFKKEGEHYSLINADSCQNPTIIGASSA